MESSLDYELVIEERDETIAQLKKQLAAAQDLVDAVLRWRDYDEDPRNDPKGPGWTTAPLVGMFQAVDRYRRDRGTPLHVYRFENTFDWFVAASPANALREWTEHHDPEPVELVPEFHQLPDDEDFEKGDWDGEGQETKTCAEWAEAHGPGFLAKEL